MSKSGCGCAVILIICVVVVFFFFHRVDKTDPGEYEKVCRQYYSRVYEETHPDWEVEDKTRAAVSEFEKLDSKNRKEAYDKMEKKSRE